MKVQSEKLWQEQKNVLQNTLDEDILQAYYEVIEEVTNKAEELLEGSDLTPDSVVFAIREGFKGYVEERGYLIPDVQASLLVVLILHWELGEELSEGLSPIEFSLVAEAMTFHLDNKAERASRGD